MRERPRQERVIQLRPFSVPRNGNVGSEGGGGGGGGDLHNLIILRRVVIGRRLRNIMQIVSKRERKRGKCQRYNNGASKPHEPAIDWSKLENRRLVLVNLQNLKGVHTLWKLSVKTRNVTGVSSNSPWENQRSLCNVKNSTIGTHWTDLIAYCSNWSEYYRNEFSKIFFVNGNQIWTPPIRGMRIQAEFHFETLIRHISLHFAISYMTPIVIRNYHLLPR